jgi:hypothetical protein
MLPYDRVFIREIFEVDVELIDVFEREKPFHTEGIIITDECSL